MKKFLLSAGALLLVVGLALSWVGMRMGGETRATVRLFGRSWDVYAPSAGWDVVSASVEATPTAAPAASLDQALEEAEDVAVAGRDTTPFSSIDLDVDLGEVTIAAGDGFGVEIECWGKGYEIDHWYSGGTLHIEDTDNGIKVIPDSFGSNITVYVPTDVWLESLQVDLDLGSLTLAGLNITYADIDLDLGSLTGEALTVVNHFEVDADLGEVNLFGDLGEYVDISADLGSVQLGLSRPVSEYCWELEADMGSITVDGKKQHANDENEVTGGHGNRTIEVDASLGSITLDFGLEFAGEASRATPPSESVAQEGDAAVTIDRGSLSAPESVWVETAK